MEKLFIRSSKADTPVAGGIEKSSMIDVRDLEIERHYLSEAIKSSHNSAEYDFLSRKLRSIEDELQGGPSSVPKATLTTTTTSTITTTGMMVEEEEEEEEHEVQQQQRSHHQCQHRQLLINWYW